jgi:acetamidase/formamidase
MSTATAAKPRAAARHHHLRAGPDSAHWGFIDAKLKPAITIESGDTVTIDCVSGNPEHIPPKELGAQVILPEHLEIHQKVQKGSGNHIYTGPVYVNGAEPGDVLEVRIKDIALRQDWGWNQFRPLVGTLPEDFPFTQVIHIKLDRDKMIATPPWGLPIPIRPFFGQLVVAPPAAYGRQNSKEPREYGGNIDCKELTAGSTIYLPVWTQGALFSTGDGHAAQGDGEVCGTAIETALTGTFEFIVRKDMKLSVPRAESPTHFITLGLHTDLDDAAKQALREMLDWLEQMLGISRGHAYAMCSFVCDMHITQLVNNVIGVHAMIDKKRLQKS